MSKKKEKKQEEKRSDWHFGPNATNSAGTGILNTISEDTTMMPIKVINGIGGVYVPVDQCNHTIHGKITFDKIDEINHPSHYTQGKIEPISVIHDWKLGFWLGNCVKYIARSEHKGTLLKDLKKARWYLDDYIKRLENGEDPK